MPEKVAAFELAAGVLEVSGLPLNGKSVVLKQGDKQKVTHPDDLAVWRGTKGVTETSSKSKGGGR